MKKVKFEGIFPAMTVSFMANGALDIKGIKKNVEFLMKEGCAGIVCNGSTGEAVNLTREERVAVIKATREAMNGKGKIIAGTGAPTTNVALELTKDAMEAGADASLVITPFNAIPNKEGLYLHYKAISEVGIPIIIYNLPAHTGVEVDYDTIERLIKLDNIIGIKESSGNFSYFSELVRLFADRFTIFSGCDDLSFQCFCLGVKAVILALGNIAPKMLVEQLALVQAGKYEEAREVYFKLLPIGRAIGASVNFPAPVKEAVRLLGRSSSTPRMPILPVEKAESESIAEALKFAGLL